MFPSAIKRKPKPLAEAIESEDNELASMRYPDLARQLYDAIGCQKTELEHMICKLLRVRTCRIVPSNLWASGSFNAAILVRLPQGKNAYLRLPFGHRIGEGPFPGNADEKIQTETATYIWLQEHCPDVPIPTFTICPPFHPPYPPSGFLLISEAQGKRLDRSWHKHHDDENRRKTLFRGLSRITVSMNAMPQPRIGALRLQDDDTIALNNRPLNLYMHMLENEGVSSGIPRGRMYAEVDGYLSDLLSLQDAKLRGQPNAIFDVEDGQLQLAACAGMRAVMHHFVDPGTRDGPFYLTLNDLIQSNIFVDEQWNVTSIIDLEWTHTLPAEMQSPPYWLTSKSVDGFYEQKDREEFDEAVKEYLTVYEEEEVRRGGSGRQAEVQRRAWDSWQFLVLPGRDGAQGHVQSL
ncbi:phosphotransferase enzyme family protein [Beauveria bassiana ARSEF 2860]|uniref:Phosphotransferase enzyme family protein n=1 Tax=Beauveria bassiana (strain ARSEF 2860) TaxID=655819 RepID=J4UHZ5_BEAB2|nr:phosphotransferase enzyme family protein [Beauveria bassiana ARSEF 2860]EJP62982.1 phosphotransferase enzyme family protein [Beauveria bassiana ARSEF 2860]